MMRFYDAKDESELKWVEGILRKGGVEYFVRESGTDDTMPQVHVAEEDVSWAEELLKETHRMH